jgi:DNA-directed RNA polymerase subunit M/transcription elongation factor TFIIS
LAILDPICPKCGCKMILALPRDGKGSVILQCPRCEPSDPLKSENVERWIRSSLRPPV